jgi:hypothetical protein
MNQLSKYFRVYVALYSLVFSLWVVYLLLNYFEIIKSTPFLIASFLWVNIAFLVMGVLFLGYKYLVRKGKDLNTVDVIFTLIYNMIFLVIFLADPFYLLAKALD